MSERRLPATMVFLAALILLAVAAAVIGGVTLYVQNRAQTRVHGEAITGGRVANAPAHFAAYGCGSCHVIPGIDGANGKVGQAAVQLAAQAGARVIAVQRRPGPFEGYACRPVEVIDASDPAGRAVGAQVRDLTDGRGVQLVYNTVGGAYFEAANQSMGKGATQIFIATDQRAVPFDRFAAILTPAYPDELERQLVLSMIQVLWDRGEANGYAWHMTRDPYRRTPRHTVLLHQAFGDHQVANVATEVEARTIGARLRTPALDPGRSADGLGARHRAR